MSATLVSSIGTRCKESKLLCGKLDVTVRASSRDVVTVGSVISTITTAGSAWAEMTAPSLDDLKQYQLELESNASKLASSAVSEAAKTTREFQTPSLDMDAVDLNAAADMAPLLIGLAVGIVIVGAVITVVTGSNKGPKIQVRPDFMCRVIRPQDIIRAGFEPCPASQIAESDIFP